jgi:3-oxoacyl-[acyl-carrier protein] reductase|tara:strand:+ start:303 stop:1007 length:705 start_codon:yes stop_codon:yes gene_type:complete
MKKILIIGGNSSIGLSIIKKFVDKGDYVITTYNDKANRENLLGENIQSIHLDLENEKSIDKFTKQLYKITNKIDSAIFLSSILPGKKFTQYEDNDIDKVMAINFTGQVKLLHRLIKIFKKNSSLLMFSSISAEKGSYDPIYSASKGALSSFVKSIIPHLPKEVRINTIAPGLIEGSTMFKNMSGSLRTKHKSKITSNKFLNIEDLSQIVFDLCQDHWSHLNGACIDLNGGEHVR